MAVLVIETYEHEYPKTGTGQLVKNLVSLPAGKFDTFNEARAAAMALMQRMEEHNQPRQQWVNIVGDQPNWPQKTEQLAILIPTRLAKTIGVTSSLPLKETECDGICERRSPLADALRYRSPKANGKEAVRATTPIRDEFRPAVNSLSVHPLLTISVAVGIFVFLIWALNAGLDELFPARKEQRAVPVEVEMQWERENARRHWEP